MAKRRTERQARRAQAPTGGAIPERVPLDGDVGSELDLSGVGSDYHVPVMAREVLRWLEPRPGAVVLDATLGGGGHAALLAERLGRGGTLIGVDQDAEAIAAAGRRLASLGNGGDGARVLLVQARFDRLREALEAQDIGAVDGVLFDLGVSSHQLDAPERGFSFKEPERPLDMRMDPDAGAPTAADLLNTADAATLTGWFREYADERWAARIAQFAVARREDVGPFAAVGDLLAAVRAAVPAAVREAAGSIHPATRVFQALRIAVNDEYAVLERGLEQAVALLRPGSGARVAVISYHSGEDRIVKRAFNKWSGRREREAGEPAALDLPARKPLTPSADEIALNPRARSAKMRVAQRR